MFPGLILFTVIAGEPAPYVASMKFDDPLNSMFVAAISSNISG